MKRILIALTLTLSACAAPQQNEVEIEARTSEPALFDAPAMVAPVVEPLCPEIEIASGDGIGGTGCK